MDDNYEYIASTPVLIIFIIHLTQTIIKISVCPFVRPSVRAHRSSVVTIIFIRASQKHLEYSNYVGRQNAVERYVCPAKAQDTHICEVIYTVIESVYVR